MMIKPDVTGCQLWCRQWLAALGTLMLNTYNDTGLCWVLSLVVGKCIGLQPTDQETKSRDVRNDSTCPHEVPCHVADGRIGLPQCKAIRYMPDIQVEVSSDKTAANASTRCCRMLPSDGYGFSNAVVMVQLLIQASATQDQAAAPALTRYCATSPTDG